MLVVEAECDWTPEWRRQNGIRRLQFRYENECKGLDETPEFIIVTRALDFKLEWVIECSYDFDYEGSGDLISWNKIKLLKHDKYIIREFKVQVTANEGVLVIEKLSPANNWALKGIKGDKAGDIVITFEFHIEDVGLRSVNEDYEKIFESKKHCDVIFVSEEEEILAHKLILSARSKVFAAMFDSDMMEKKTGRVEIVDIEPCIFKQLLRFIYCGKVDLSINIDKVLKLMVAADKYSVKDLVDSCAHRLIFTGHPVYPQKVFEILIIASFINCDDLKKKCIDEIIRFKFRSEVQEGYGELKKSHPDLAFEICDAFMQKEFEVVKKYRRYQKNVEEKREIVDEEK